MSYTMKVDLLLKKLKSPNIESKVELMEISSYLKRNLTHQEVKLRMMMMNKVLVLRKLMTHSTCKLKELLLINLIIEKMFTLNK